MTNKKKQNKQKKKEDEDTVKDGDRIAFILEVIFFINLCIGVGGFIIGGLR